MSKDWSFFGFANAFDKHVKEQLPWYDLASNAMGLIARHYIPKNGRVYDLGASTGNVDGAWLKIKEIGALPIGFSETPPEPPEPTPEEIKQNRILEINKELNEIDLKSIRPERSIRTGRGTDFDTQKLVELEDQADVLRAELQGFVVG